MNRFSNFKIHRRIYSHGLNYSFYSVQQDNYTFFAGPYMAYKRQNLLFASSKRQHLLLASRRRKDFSRWRAL